MSIRDWPATERPREKLLELGSASLSDAELLAIFLRTGVAGKSAVDLARHLLMQFGSLRSLFEADQQAFASQLGLGPAKFAQLQAVQAEAFHQPLERGREHGLVAGGGVRSVGAGERDSIAANDRYPT